MSKLLSDLGYYLKESSVEFVPWNPVPQNFDSTGFRADESVILPYERPFYYLKSLESLPPYAADFGFQWTQLYDDYIKDSYKNLGQFLRLGVNPEILIGRDCLDVGCGLGRFSQICLGRANYVFGVDVSQAVLEAARLIRSNKFVPVQASADDMPLKDHSFDFVCCWGVLHHTEDPSKTLSELWLVLKPGGCLAICVYPRTSWYLKRSLLAKYFSALDEYEMLKFSNALTSLSHTCQLTSQTFIKMLSSDLCYTVKNTKERTRIVLYDGLGPAFHYLLDSEWFAMESEKLQGLASIHSVDKPFAVTRLIKAK